jgi:hypothetical protein
MLFLVGSSGYVGPASARYFDSRAHLWRGVSHQEFNPHQPERLPR